MSEHSITVAARRSGISAGLIRMWELRYGAVHPSRDASGRRRYSAAQIERLGLLRRAVERGETISRVAGLTDGELAALVETPMARPGSPAHTGLVAALIGRARRAIQEEGARQLTTILQEGVEILGYRGVARRVIGPLALDLAREGALDRERSRSLETLLEGIPDLRPLPFATPDRPPGLLVWRRQDEDWPLLPGTLRILAEAQGWRVTLVTGREPGTLEGLRRVVALPALGRSPERMLQRLESRPPGTEIFIFLAGDDESRPSGCRILKDMEDFCETLDGSRIT